MGTIAFTIADNRRIGHDLSWMKESLADPKALLSRAHTPGNPVVKAIKALSEGLTDYKYHAHQLARHEHPETDLEYFFYPVNQATYHPPTNFPGCSLEETATIKAALKARMLQKNRKALLYPPETLAIRKTLAAISRYCDDITAQLQENYKDSALPLPATDLIAAHHQIRRAAMVIQQETKWVEAYGS